MPSLRRARRSHAMRTVACALIGALLFALVPLDASAAIPSPVVAASRGLTEAAAVSRLARSGSGLPVTVAVIVWNPSILAKSAFGELLAHTGNDPQPYAFTGEPYDPNIGWQYHRARWMDASVGRFAGMDPFSGRPFDPQTLHKYLYGGADPASNIDPTGRSFFTTAVAAGALIGALVAISVVQPRGIIETARVGLIGALVGALLIGGLAYWAVGGSALGASAASGAGVAAGTASFGAAGMTAQQAVRATASVSQLQHGFNHVKTVLGLGNWDSKTGEAFRQIVQTALQYPAAIVRDFYMRQGQRVVDVYLTKAPNGQPFAVYVDATTGELVTVVVVNEQHLTNWGATAFR